MESLAPAEPVTLSPEELEMRQRFRLAEQTRELNLSGLALRSVPEEVFSEEMTRHLTTLNLGYNDLEEIPAHINELRALEHLVLGNNPLRHVPVQLSECAQLKTLDLRATFITTLPCELGRLKLLYHTDLRGAPLQRELEGFQTNTKGLLQHLDAVDQRTTLLKRLREGITSGVYYDVADSALGKEQIPLIEDAVCRRFQDLEELRTLVRNCNRLFPDQLRPDMDHEAEADRVREHFVTLRRQNERKKLASDLELKMRAIYYDRIDPSEVEHYIASIYDSIPLLEDIQFLIKYSPRLFPDRAEDVTGPGIAAAVEALQLDLTQQREAAVNGLVQALATLYSDQEPQKVRELAEDVAKAFRKERFATKRELEYLKKLSADAAVLFPAEASAATVNGVRTTFFARERAARAATANAMA